MKFSIVIPMYKVEDFIDLCINSVLNQDYNDYEIILVDDGSPDKSGSIADRYARENDNITVIHQKNGGLSSARNAGIDAAKGDYIILLDSDDSLISGSLQELSSKMTDEVDVFYANVVKVQNGMPEKIVHKANLECNTIYSGVEALNRELSNGTKYSAMATAGIYRRVFLNSMCLRFKEGILHEDEEWSPRVELKASKIEYLDVNFYLYILRDGSITTNLKKNKNAKDIIDICKELREMYRTLESADLKRNLECYLAKLYIHAVSVLIRENEKIKIDKTFVRNKGITNKDAIRFTVFDVSPSFYAKVIDKRFVNQ